MQDAVGGSRDPPPALPTHRQQPAARVSRLPWVPPTPPASSPPASLRRTLPTGIDATFLQPTGCMPRPVRGVPSTRSISGLPRMDTITRQDRITLKNLRSRISRARKRCASPPPSCSTAGPSPKPATTDTAARRSCALQGQAALLAQAEEFAKSLPPGIASTSNAKTTSRFHRHDARLPGTTGWRCHARGAQAAHRVQPRHRQQGAVHQGRQAAVPQGHIKLKAITDRAAYFAKLRSRQDQPIVILAELPADEVFAIWKQHVLGDKPRAIQPHRTVATAPHLLRGFLCLCVHQSGLDQMPISNRRGAPHEAARMLADSSHMPAARFQAAAGFSPRNPPVIASIARTRVAKTLMLFSTACGAAIPWRDGPAFPRSPSMSQQASFGRFWSIGLDLLRQVPAARSPAQSRWPLLHRHARYRRSRFAESRVLPQPCRGSTCSKGRLVPARRSPIQLEESRREPATAAGSRRSDRSGRTAFQRRAPSLFRGMEARCRDRRARKWFGDGTREGLEQAKSKWDLRPDMLRLNDALGVLSNGERHVPVRDGQLLQRARGRCHAQARHFSGLSDFDGLDLPRRQVIADLLLNYSGWWPVPGTPSSLRSRDPAMRTCASPEAMSSRFQCPASASGGSLRMPSSARAGSVHSSKEPSRPTITTKPPAFSCSTV